MAFGLRGPRRRILGTVFSGIVEGVGKGVVNVAPGDAVCGMTGMSMGAHAEYVCAGIGPGPGEKKPGRVSTLLNPARL